MIKIYHVPFFRSARVIWLMEELGEPYELDITPFPLDEAFKGRTGIGAVPAIDDDGIVMGESIAILQYLTGRRLQRSMELGLTVGPNPDPAAYAEHLQFLHLGEASLMTPVAMVARTRRTAPEAERDNFTVQACERLFVARVGAVERRLEDGRPFLTGDRLTIADISVGYALAYARKRELDELIPPLTTTYLDRLSARPAFQKAMAG